MPVVVMIDSAASLNKALVKKFNLILIPFNIEFDDKSYKDVIDIKNTNVIEQLINEKNCLPTIKYFNEKKVEATIIKELNKGNDILFITVSSLLSDVYSRVCKIASKYPGNVEVIDSLNVGAGETLLALLARDFIDSGHGIRQTTLYLNKMKYLIKSSYLIGDFSYLYRQGLSVNIENNYLRLYNRTPMVDIIDGKIVLTCNAREVDIAYQVLKNIICDNSRFINNSNMVISFSNNKSKANELKKYSNRYVKDLNVNVVENSSTIYINSGSNTIGLAYLVNK